MLELDAQKLKEPQFVEQLTKDVEEIVANNLGSEAIGLAYRLNNIFQKEPGFEQENPDLYQQYQQLLTYLSFVTITGLTDEEIFDLFKNRFVAVFEIFKINPFFDLIDKIRGFLVSLPIYQWRNSFKKDLIGKLFENQEKITSAPLKDSTGKEIGPTVSNWLRDYQSAFGPTAHVDKVKQIEYLTHSQNTKNLSTEERERLSHLLNLYEFLKLDSLTLDGVEESIDFIIGNKIKILSSGRLEEVPVPVGAVLGGMGPGAAEIAEGAEVEAKTVGLEPRPAPAKPEAEEPEIGTGGLEAVIPGPKLEEEVESLKEEPKTEEKNREEEVPAEEKIPEKEVSREVEKPAEIEKADKKEEVVSEKKESPSADLEIEEIVKEIDKYQKEAPSSKPKTGLTVEQAIDEVIKSLELTFADEMMERRFKNILQSYLNDVRDQIETMVVLKRPVKIGGMGFDEAKADEILWLLKDIQEKLIKQPVEVREAKRIEARPGLAEGLIRPEEMVIKPEESEKKAPQPKFDKVKFEAGPLWRPKEPTPPPVKKEPIISQTEKEKMLKILEGREEEKKPKAEKETVVPIRRPFGPEPGKRVLEDVKMKPRIYGPIEELKAIKLADWRSFGSPQESINRIQDKIEFLAEQSLIKKAQGIKAWQSSEVYRLYLEIGEEALEKQQSVETIIKLREKERRPYLTPEEFNKISELNQKLRF